MKAPEAFHACCRKCKHFDHCDTPCEPVRSWISQDGDVYEIAVKGRVKGKPIVVVYPVHRQVRFSELSGEAPLDLTEGFSTETFESPFRHFEPKKKQTGVFIAKLGFNTPPLAALLKLNYE